MEKSKIQHNNKNLKPQNTNKVYNRTKINNTTKGTMAQGITVSVCV